MHPQSATVGARLGRRLNLVISVAGAKAPDPVAFVGGLLSSIIGNAAGLVGPQTAAQLLRICLERLDGQPQLALPPGARLPLASVEERVARGAMSINAARAEAAKVVAEVVSGESTTDPNAPSDTLEWIWHLDLHLTEHDERHAGLALRAAWPHVRKYLVELSARAGASSAAQITPQQILELRDAAVLLRDAGHPRRADMLAEIARAASERPDA
jgi:hypothetical protein